MMMQQTEVLTLRLERMIRADRERVWAAWTTPEIMRKWSAPAGMSVESGEMDLVPGGRWRAMIVHPDGSRHEAFGVYSEVTPPERLVYSHAWHHDGGPATPDTTVTVEFIAEAGGTRVVLTQVGFESAGSLEGHTQGWSSTLDRFVAVFNQEAS